MEMLVLVYVPPQWALRQLRERRYSHCIERQVMLHRTGWLRGSTGTANRVPAYRRFYR